MSEALLLTLPKLTAQRVRWSEILSDVLVRFFALIPLSALGFIMFMIVRKGAGTVTWQFLTQAPLNGMTLAKPILFFKRCCAGMTQPGLKRSGPNPPTQMALASATVSAMNSLPPWLGFPQVQPTLQNVT